MVRLQTFQRGKNTDPVPPQAIFEMKLVLAEFVKTFEFSTTGGDIRTRMTMGVQQPYIAGRPEDGVQVPLRVKLVGS